MRIATADTEILGYEIPKGATVMCNAQFMTEPQEVREEVRSKTWKAAEEKRGREFQMMDLKAFLPDRRLIRDEHGSEVFDGGALTRLAFGLGPRGCFGTSCLILLPHAAFARSLVVIWLLMYSKLLLFLFAMLSTLFFLSFGWLDLADCFHQASDWLCKNSASYSCCLF